MHRLTAQTAGRRGASRSWSFLVALPWLVAAAPAGAQQPRGDHGVAGSNPADGSGLVVPVPTFREVRPPAGYLEAIRAGTRTVEGLPGPSYWEQRVDYRIDARLDPETATVRGSETITVHNGSPYPRLSLVLHLYQNVLAEGVARNRSVQLTGGMKIGTVSAAGVALEPIELSGFRGRRSEEDAQVGYHVDGTLMSVRLPEPIQPGGTVQLQVDWSFIVSGGGGFRNGHLDHEIFNVAQWYPQVAVFDDVFGQDRTPYLGLGEFYADYGDFDVSVTVPEGWIVVGTGSLDNPDEVLTPEAARRLASAPSADTVISIVGPADRRVGRATASSSDGTLIWRFSARNVRDFAFAAGGTYVWDATGADPGPGHDRVLVQNVYDPEVTHWSEATLYAKHAIEFFSRYILPYPYPQATTAYGPPQVNGMEYPMITFINRAAPGRPLNSVVSHELSHFWMPMIVGTKEMAYAWMDEGLTTFNNSLSMADYYGTEVTRPGENEEYLAAARLGFEVPIMQHTDYAENLFGRTVAAYAKPGMLLHVLRHMIGSEGFDLAYREYARAWAFKHPMPWDFFAVVERAAGEDLDWFWQPWFYQTATLDQAVEAVEPTSSGVRITVTNLSDGVMPVEIGIESADGSRHTVVWPASVWAGTRRAAREVAVDGKVSRVTIDPDGYYPDLDRSNNSWEAAAD